MTTHARETPKCPCFKIQLLPEGISCFKPNQPKTPWPISYVATEISPPLTQMSPPSMHMSPRSFLPVAVGTLPQTEPPFRRAMPSRLPFPPVRLVKTPGLIPYSTFLGYQNRNGIPKQEQNVRMKESPENSYNTAKPACSNSLPLGRIGRPCIGNGQKRGFSILSPVFLTLGVSSPPARNCPVPH